MGKGQPRQFPLPEVGSVYGRWTTIGEAFLKADKNGRTSTYVPCRCLCGKETSVFFPNLYRCVSLGCGCARVNSNADRFYKHGGTNSKLYSVWCGVKSRCGNVRSTSYGNYGGRGISICPEWASDFAAFEKWANASGYSEGLQLDRTDTYGDYCPENCRWVTAKVNCQNTRRNVLVTAFGETKCISEWAGDARCKPSQELLRMRLKNKMEPEEAISKAPKWQKRKTITIESRVRDLIQAYDSGDEVQFLKSLNELR